MKLGYNKITETITMGQKNPNYHVAFDNILDLNIYDDISSIESWYDSDVLDWSRRRDEIKPLFFEKAGNDLSNFNTLSDYEKQIGAYLFYLPYNIRIQIFTNEQDAENWKYLLNKTKTSREQCIEAMRKAVGEKIRIGELTLEQTQTFDNDTTRMISLFERSNHPEFKLWLTSTSATINGVLLDYTTTGFSSKNYYTLGLKDILLGIYNGNY